MEFSGQQIGVPAFDVLWEAAMPGVPKPAVLHCPSPGDTAEQRGRVVRDELARLGRAGYVGPRGTFDEVVSVLDTVGRPRLAVDVRRYEWVADEHGQPTLVRFGIRAATSGGRGAVAMLGPEWFQAWSFPAGSLVDEVVGLFVAWAAPAKFAGVSLYPDQLGANVRPARRGTETALRLMEGPYLRRAHICAVARDPVGGRERVSESLVLNDVHAGRFLVFMARNQLTIAPGGRGTFERKLKELIEPASRY